MFVYLQFKFGRDLTSDLLDVMSSAIEDVAGSGYCGQAAEAFTKQLDRQLSIREDKCAGVRWVQLFSTFC